jgi:hypothetical protein
MTEDKYIEFLRISTPGPYGIPLKVVEDNDNEILFQIEIDDILHTFGIQKSEIVNMISSPDQENLTYLDVSIKSMAKLYSKISAVVHSEKNQFIL